MGSDFAGFLKGSLVLVDTSSILLVSTNDVDSEIFWSNLISKASASDTTIIIPSGVIRELDKHQSSGRVGEEIVEASKRALKKLLELQKAKDVFVVDDHMNTKKANGVFADPYFINFVNTYKMSKNLYIIMQDVDMMKDIHRTVKFDSLSGRIKGANGGEVQIVKQKKVAVLKVARRGSGDDAVVEAGVLRWFYPDWTLADIAQEIGRPVDECIAKLKAISGKDFQASETLSKSYERRLKEAFGLISSIDERREKKPEHANVQKSAFASVDADKPFETEQKPLESKLPEFKPVWD